MAGFQDGTITDAVNDPNGISGLSPDAMLFDGTGDKVVYENEGALADIGSTNFTVCCWIKTTDASANRLKMITKEAGDPRFYMAKLETSQRLYFLIDDGVAAIATVNGTGPVINTGEWVHCVAVVDFSSVIRLYVNGIHSTSQDSISITALGSVANTTKLQASGSGGGAWDGSIAHLRIYNRGITDGEISKLVRLKE